MADFSVSLNNLAGCENELKKCADEILRLQIDLRRVTTQVALHSEANMQIRRRLNQLNRVMFNDYNKVNRLRGTLGSVSVAYSRAEQSLVGGDFSVGNAVKSSGNKSKKKTKQRFKINWLKEVTDTTVKVVSKAGVPGAGIGAVYEIVRNGIGEGKKSSYVKAAKGFFEAISKSVGKAKKAGKDKITVDWKKFLGIDKSLEKYKEVVGPTKRFKAAFSDKFKSKFNVKSEGVGWALTVVAAGFDNYDEYKSGEISGKRAVAETIGESAITIAEGAIVSSLVTAGLAAIGFTAAPAVVVAGVGVLVTWGADLLCKHFTGKGVAEAVSDLVIDGVGKGVKIAKEGITTWWKRATRKYSLAGAW